MPLRRAAWSAFRRLLTIAFRGAALSFDVRHLPGSLAIS
jgi:hypothetical protein